MCYCEPRFKAVYLIIIQKCAFPGIFNSRAVLEKGVKIVYNTADMINDLKLKRLFRFEEENNE